MLRSTHNVMSIPFFENPHLFAVTAGNAVHSQILRRQIQQLAASLYEHHDDGLLVRQPRPTAALRSCPSVAVLARRLADHCQKPTQTAGSKAGRMLVVRTVY